MGTAGREGERLWSYDFVAARTEDGLPLRILNVVDEFTRRCVGCRVDRSVGARDIISELEQLFERHGKPRLLRSDNGREFIAETLADWLKDQGVTQIFIEKASPQQNAYVERFNGSMRDELLNGEFFRTVLEARVVINEWIDGYNTIRPHRGLDYKTPAAFYATLSDGSR
jgi:transposase InsO family protein